MVGLPVQAPSQMLQTWLGTRDTLPYRSQCPLPGQQMEITKKMVRSAGKDNTCQMTMAGPPSTLRLHCSRSALAGACWGCPGASPNLCCSRPTLDRSPHPSRPTPQPSSTPVSPHIHGRPPPPSPPPAQSSPAPTSWFGMGGWRVEAGFQPRGQLLEGLYCKCPPVRPTA